MKTPLITVSHLTVQSGGRTLLHDVSLMIYEGDVTLLVGGSGSGKSVFMKILAGLITPRHPSFQISGSIRIGDQEILTTLPPIGRRRIPVGIVFQDYGLMDDYTLVQNIDFAFAHSPFRMPREQRKNFWLRLQQKLELDPKLSLRHASGGQKRRMAIARTLAYNPDILIYDEPTAGLDPPMMHKVAQLVRDTHAGFCKRGSIVVTHQYQDFLPLVDRILFLDPAQQNIDEVSAQDLENKAQTGQFQVPPPAVIATGLGRKLWDGFIKMLASTPGWCLHVMVWLLGFWLRLFPCWRSPLWGARFVGHYLRLVTFVSAILYVGMAGVIIGFVSTYFTFKFLPYGQFTRPLITEDVFAALGYGLFRIIIPILVSILVAARCGAAVTSDLGNRVYLQEIDAMKSLGASPAAYLKTGLLYAFLLGLPLLTWIAFWLAKLVAMGVFVVMHPQHNLIFADAIFHSFIAQGGELFFKGTGWVVAKQLVCGLGLANICYAIGIGPKASPQHISRDITRAVIWGTLFVLLAHLVFALLEF